MTSKVRSIIFGSFLTVALSVSLLVGYISFTGAWFTDFAGATDTLTFGNVNIAFSSNTFGMENNKTEVSPGEIFNMQTISVGAVSGSASCYIRLKVELTGDNASNFILNSNTIGSENTISIAGVNNSYCWAKIDEYYYLAEDTLVDADTDLDDITLIAVEGGGSAYNLQIKHILTNKSLNADNGGQQSTILVTAQAMQTANYESTSWSVFD